MGDRCTKSIPVSLSNPLIEKNQDLYVGCGHRLAVCSKGTGVTRQWVDKNVDVFSCIHCKQYTAVCLGRTVRGKNRWREVIRAIDDPQKIVVFSTAPSVRIGLGKCFGGRPGGSVEGRIVSALRELRADYVLDMAFSTDLTIMKEGTKFPRHFPVGGHPLPQLTSCCPTQVRYAETFHPEWTGCLSNTKGPIDMQGALIKIYLIRKQGIDPGRTVNVAVAPCTAKKFEILREGLCSSRVYQSIPGLVNNGYVLTTRGLTEWITKSGTGFYSLDPSSFDLLIGGGDRTGVIFGNAGGVMEAALRMAYSIAGGKELMDLLLEYRPARGLDQIKETIVSPGGRDVRVAVIYDTRAAKQLTGAGNINSYDLVEVMACPGGCISGGGQPDSGILSVPDRLRMERIKSFYRVDGQRMVRGSLDNRETKRLYERFLGEPIDELAQTLFRICYRSRKGGE